MNEQSFTLYQQNTEIYNISYIFTGYRQFLTRRATPGHHIYADLPRSTFAVQQRRDQLSEKLYNENTRILFIWFFNIHFSFYHAARKFRNIFTRRKTVNDEK